jgi:acyl-coenzyme A thioesterase PaaI-like protein
LTSEVARRPRQAVSTEGFRFEFAEHNCFACGTLNAHGLRLDLHLAPERCWTELELDPRFQGWDEIAHGGIVATILDEVMAWSLVATDNWGVTARLNVAFRRPVALAMPIRAEGWITQSRRRLVETAARIVDLGTGTELTAATGLYVAADAARKAELQARYGFRRLDRDAEAPRS